MELEDGEMPPPPPPPPPPSSSYGAGDQQHAGYGNGYGQQQQAYGGYGDQQQQEGYGYGGYGAAAGGQQQQQQQQQVCGWVGRVETSVLREHRGPVVRASFWLQTIPDLLCAACRYWDAQHSAPQTVVNLSMPLLSMPLLALVLSAAHLTPSLCLVATFIFPIPIIPFLTASPGRGPTQMAEPTEGASWDWAWLTVSSHMHTPP